MTRYIIYAPHKCGSSILFRILCDIFNKTLKEDTKNKVETSNGFGEIILSRNYDLNTLDVQNDKLICIPRNPISMAISAFYSFGYTHVQPPHLSTEEWQKRRSSIQTMGFENYIDKHFAQHYKKIVNIFDLECANKIVLPYEFMISKFDAFLKDFLIAIDMQDCYSKTLERWKSSFDPIEDQSKKIISNEYKEHKRTTDIYEWKKKIPNEDLVRYIAQYPFILKYEKFSEKLL